MTLADELRRVVPPSVTSPGRLVIRHEDSAPIAPIVTERMAAFDEWITNRKGPFTTHDIADEMGLTVKQASNQLRRYQNRGLLTQRGKVHTGKMPMLVWSYSPNAPSC